MNGSRYILHVDADAFFASVEQALRPELLGLPVIVGANDRGVVSAASYEARAYGVHSAMPVAQARRLCPCGVFLHPTLGAYKEYSQAMFHIIERYSPMVERTSVDEGYVDLTGTFRLHGAPPWAVADRILREVRAALRINASGGMAGGRTPAKMATGLAKPNGLLYLEPPSALKLLHGLPVGKIPGVGKRTREVLEESGISTVGDLCGTPPARRRSLLGAWGDRIVHSILAPESLSIREDAVRYQKSYSKDRTLECDTNDEAELRGHVRDLAERLTCRLRADGRGATTVTLKIRYADFTETSRSRRLRYPTDRTADIVHGLDVLFRHALTSTTRVRQVGVKLSGIGARACQMDLFDRRGLQHDRRDRAVDQIRSRFGFESIARC